MHTPHTLTSLRQPRSFGKRLARSASRGLSLIELLISIALGLIIVTALVALYGNMMRTNNEMAKSNQLIENGRFAVQLMQEDVAHAGFWGPIEALTATALPDPCQAWAAVTATDRVNLLTIPVQGYANGALLAGCGVTGVVAKSDVLVVRHANTCVAGANCDGGTDTGPHIQVSGCRTDAPPEPSYLLETVAVLNARPVRIRNKDCATEAARRKMVVNIYYVANSASGIPTLMRIGYSNGAYTAPQPLIDGIEAFRVEFGIDNLGSNGLAISATNPADGNADTYVSCAPTCALADLANVVTVKLHVLSRNLEPTAGHQDTKSYKVGPLAVAATNDGYKRHVFTTAVRVVNASSRRETP